MPTVPKTFDAEEAKLFRKIIKQMKDLNIFHEIDAYQIERVVKLIMKAREMEPQILELGDSTEEMVYLQKYATICNAINGTMDRLGISNTKRNPLKRDRGKDDSLSKKEKDERDRWLEVVK